NRLKLGRSLVRVITIKLGFQHGDVRMLLHFLLETFFTLVSRRYAGRYVRNIDLPFVANRFRQRACGNLAAQNVVRRNVRERKIGVATSGLVMTVTDEGVD